MLLCTRQVAPLSSDCSMKSPPTVHRCFPSAVPKIEPNRVSPTFFCTCHVAPPSSDRATVPCPRDPAIRASRFSVIATSPPTTQTCCPSGVQKIFVKYSSGTLIRDRQVAPPSSDCRMKSPPAAHRCFPSAVPKIECNSLSPRFFCTCHDTPPSSDCATVPCPPCGWTLHCPPAIHKRSPSAVPNMELTSSPDTFSRARHVVPPSSDCSILPSNVHTWFPSAVLKIHGSNVRFAPLARACQVAPRSSDCRIVGE